MKEITGPMGTRMSMFDGRSFHRIGRGEKYRVFHDILIIRSHSTLIVGAEMSLSELYYDCVPSLRTICTYLVIMEQGELFTTKNMGHRDIIMIHARKT